MLGIETRLKNDNKSRAKSNLSIEDVMVCLSFFLFWFIIRVGMSNIIESNTQRLATISMDTGIVERARKWFLFLLVLKL